MLAKHGDLRPLPALRRLVSAGEPIEPETIAVFREATGPGDRPTATARPRPARSAATCAGERDPARDGSMGRPLPGIETRIVDGELQLRAASSPTFFARYLDGERFEGEWWATGDRVREDADGYLWFEGRGDDLILSSGYRIGPFEVESALRLPPRRRRGRRGRRARPRARLRRPRDRRPPRRRGRPPRSSPRELQEHVKAQTAPYKYPRIVEFADGAAEDHQRQDQAGRAARAARLRPMEEIDRKRIAALTEAQQEQFRNRTGASAETFERAVKSMPGGVPSSFQENDPWPVYIDRGEGSRVWDVDGNEYADFHNGFGVMCIGHANPTVGAAVKAQIDDGTHFAAPTDGSIVVAEELTRRFGLPQWRFNNSGTEATMDAVHLARGATGRDTILKIEGSYHGHHDSVMVSVYPPLEALGARDDPVSVPYGGGIAAGADRADPRRPLQRRRGAGERAGEDRRPGRRA